MIIHFIQTETDFMHSALRCSFFFYFAQQRKPSAFCCKTVEKSMPSSACDNGRQFVPSIIPASSMRFNLNKRRVRHAIFCFRYIKQNILSQLSFSAHLSRALKCIRNPEINKYRNCNLEDRNKKYTEKRSEPANVSVTIPYNLTYTSSSLPSCAQINLLKNE